MVKLDMDLQTLESRVLSLYRNGNAITLSGTTVRPEDIDRIWISRTDQPSSNIIALNREKDRTSGIYIPTDERWGVVSSGYDVTDEYITGPPGSHSIQSVTPVTELDPRKVFVVHGRDEHARSGLLNFLRCLDLQPIEWSAAVEKVGHPNPYIREILDAAFSMASAVLIMFTPDDEAKLGDQFLGDRDNDVERTLTGQPRPNVLLEAGMALGLYPRRTVIVEMGSLRPISDLSGMHVVRLSNSVERRQDLAQRLRLAGCQVNLEGRHWHNEGDLSVTGADSNHG